MAERKKLRKASESDEVEVAGELQHQAARPGGVHTRTASYRRLPGQPLPNPLDSSAISLSSPETSTTTHLSLAALQAALSCKLGAQFVIR